MDISRFILVVRTVTAVRHGLVAGPISARTQLPLAKQLSDLDGLTDRRRDLPLLHNLLCLSCYHIHIDGICINRQ